jgi:transcriptional regulator with GAF, ATPase, and Fis domain
MEEIPAWYYCLCPVSAIGDTDHLARRGITVSSLGEGEERGPGLLFFNEITPRLFDTVRRLSRGGLGRVCAVAVSRSMLAAGDVWQLLQAGATDVVTWDHSPQLAERLRAKLRHWHIVDQLINSPSVRRLLVGESAVWTRVLRQIVEVALTRSAVLIIGETGTGKELVAKTIHEVDSTASKGDLQVLDCTTIVPELAGSELFGHERGAFTHAVTARDGAFAKANGSTLFLDEVGELPLGLQAQLLRVVQEGMFKRVGGNSWHQTQFRLVCATNRDLIDLVRRGSFRADLYYRLASWTIKLPSLRDRREDIVPLAHHFIQQRFQFDGPPDLEEPVREYLLRREYPGNVRDLKQLVHRITDRHVGAGPIAAADVPEDERPSIAGRNEDWCGDAFGAAIRQAVGIGIGLKTIGRAAEDVAIDVALALEAGNVPRAARRLGVTGRALQIRRAAQKRHVRPHADE